MTMPSLIQNHKKKVLHTQFLKVYSDLSNASKRFEIDNGVSVYEYSLSPNYSSDILKKIMASFVGTRYGQYAGIDYDNETEGNLPYEQALGFQPKNLAGKVQKTHPCDKSIVTEEVGGRYFLLDDNLSVYLETPKAGPKICVDTNGKKGPNIYGYDWFVFVFTKEGAIKPYIGNDIANIGADMANPEDRCNYTYGSATYTCAQFALQDVSPLDPSKKYWTDFLK